MIPIQKPQKERKTYHLALQQLALLLLAHEAMVHRIKNGGVATQLFPLTLVCSTNLVNRFRISVNLHLLLHGFRKTVSPSREVDSRNGRDDRRRGYRGRSFGFDGTRGGRRSGCLRFHRFCFCNLARGGRRARNEESRVLAGRNIEDRNSVEAVDSGGFGRGFNLSKKST